MSTIPKSSYDFLKKLKKNNHRDWMQENKKEYLLSEKELKTFYSEVETALNINDEIVKLKIREVNFINS